MAKRVTVIGGGPSGMMAAYAAAVNNAEVTLIEKNEKLGKKLYITGKGRCNVTNACDDEDFFKNVLLILEHAELVEPLAEVQVG